MNENRRREGMSTFKEGGDPPDIGDRCGDRIPLLAHIVMIVTDSDQQSLLLNRGTAGRCIAAGRHRGGGTRIEIGRPPPPKVIYATRTSYS